MTTSIRARRCRLSAVAAACLLALSACSTSDSDNSESSDDLTEFSFQASWVNDAEFMGYMLAIDEGFYTDGGLDIEYLSGGPSVIPESSLLSGAADIALTSPDTTITAITEQDADFIIIGAQYQENPLGIVSLVESDITEPADLVGKTVAVPDVNRLAFAAMLEINDIPESEVTVVPYAYDPTPLIEGEVDATLDFVTNVPFTIGEQGLETNSFTLYEAGYLIPNNTVVVSTKTLENYEDELRAFLEASIQGWELNFEDPDAFPPTFADTWFEGTGRTIENEIFFNNAQQPLIESASGMFYMSEESIQDTIDTLALIGIEATPDMFDMRLFE